MSSYDGGGFDEWLEDSLHYTAETSEILKSRTASVGALLAPYRETIESGIDEYCADTMSWRDYRNGLWYRIDKRVNDLVGPIMRGERLPLTLLSVYVAAGSSERLTSARAMVDALGAAGIEVTYDWTRADCWERCLTREELTEQARKDLDVGVRRADVVWYVAPKELSEGSHAELMAGIALGKHTIASGRLDYHRRIFPLLATELFYGHEEAFAAIVRRARP